MRTKRKTKKNHSTALARKIDEFLLNRLKIGNRNVFQCKPSGGEGSATCKLCSIVSSCCVYLANSTAKTDVILSRVAYDSNSTSHVVAQINRFLRQNWFWLNRFKNVSNNVVPSSVALRDLRSAIGHNALEHHFVIVERLKLERNAIPIFLLSGETRQRWTSDSKCTGHINASTEICSRKCFFSSTQNQSVQVSNQFTSENQLLHNNWLPLLNGMASQLPTAQTLDLKRLCDNLNVQLMELNAGALLPQPMNGTQQWRHLNKTARSLRSLDPEYLCHLCFKKGHEIKDCVRVSCYLASNITLKVISWMDQRRHRRCFVENSMHSSRYLILLVFWFHCLRFSWLIQFDFHLSCLDLFVNQWKVWRARVMRCDVRRFVIRRDVCFVLYFFCESVWDASTWPA